MRMKRMSRGDRIYSNAIIVLLVLFSLVVLYPLYHMDIVSISNGYAVLRGEVTLLPKGINLTAYKYILTDRYIPGSYWNTVKYTVLGTLVNLAMTAMCAYPLSRKKLFGRNGFTFFIAFTMFFDAGLVSNFG